LKGDEEMAEQQQKIVCMFDPSCTKISVYDIHEWILEEVHIPEQSLRVIQIDGTTRYVYLKLSYDTYITDILQNTKGRLKYKDTTG
jgi:hypothetical protein